MISFPRNPVLSKKQNKNLKRKWKETKIEPLTIKIKEVTVKVSDRGFHRKELRCHTGLGL